MTWWRLPRERSAAWLRRRCSLPQQRECMSDVSRPRQVGSAFRSGVVMHGVLGGGEAAWWEKYGVIVNAICYWLH
ncbi:hypothetical protein BD309DRAFT_955421 [Dichomitus squalens]|nr:hypothetical protein BD309DRAFT_955421 [Dichomitus squalens]